MQLTLDTDIDISVQTKMSTIQQESLHEKFINSSLNENVCDITDISNRNEECQNQQVTIEVCEKNVEAVEPIAQHVSQKPMINEEINDECVELSEICDKDSAENKGNCKSEISVQIENRKEVQEKENSEILPEPGTSVQEKKMEVNNLDKLKEIQEYKDNSESDNKTEQENKQNYNLVKDELITEVVHEKIEKQTKKDHIEINNKIEAQDNVNHCMLENKIEQLDNSVIEERIELTNEIEGEVQGNIEKQSQKNIDMDCVIEDHDKVDSSVAVDKIEEEVEITSIIDPKGGEAILENIKIDETIEEQNKVSSNLTEQIIEEEFKAEDQVKRTNDIENKPVKENSEMDITLEEQDNVNTLVTDDKTEERNEKDREIDITFEEQDSVNALVTDDKIEESNEKGSEMVTFEEQDNVDVLVTDDKFEERNEKENEMDITFEEQNSVKSLVTDDKIEERNEKDSEIVIFQKQDNFNVLVTDDKIEERNEKDSEMDVTFEEQGKLNSLGTENQITGENEEISEMDVTFEETNKVNTVVIEDKTEKRNEENSEMEVIFEEQDKFNISCTKNKIEPLHTEKGGVTGEVKGLKIEIQGKKEADNLNHSSKGNKTEEPPKENSEINTKHNELCKGENEIKDKIEEQTHKIEEKTEKYSEIEDKLEDQQNEISAIIAKLEKEEEEESQIKDNIKEQYHKKSEIEEMQSTQTSVANDIIEIRDNSADEFEKNKLEFSQNALRVDCEKDTVEKQREDTSNVSSPNFEDLESKKLSQEFVSQMAISRKAKDDLELKTKNDEKVIVSTEEKVEVQDESSKNKVSEMDPNEVIDIADEKDEDFTKEEESKKGVKEKKPENAEILFSQEKAESALSSDVRGIKRTFFDEVLLNEKSSSEASVQVTNLEATNVEVTNIKKPKTESVEEKKKLTHISKLSNTLDILSDEEEDLPKEEPNKEIPVPADKECTSINIDDDDDIMLIDEESSPNDDKNKTESMPDSENQGILQEDAVVEANDKVEQFSGISESKKDTVQTAVAGPSITEMKTSETEPDLTAQAEAPLTKKPFVQPHFLNTCKKNLADMTRDELEEFCILKIVESVVDRSNLSEIKTQLKAMSQNIDEYQKKASILTKQNRDLQVVLKSIQEEQKKKSNMPITPLKITRSVGMQVLMTDKVSVRKKVQNPNTAKNNAAANSAPNRQGKTAQSQMRLQKILTNNSNSPQIPVPRLIPAVNNSNLNNMKMQPISANTTGKVASPISSSPIQSVSNGLPATPPAQKPEKRPLSRMQQNNSVTVDLTDDEPPAKVVARNATPPVRLVPPQNLLAPHRQPFGQSVSSPRKVYIPISGSQSPVGVRPGQTIMLKTISPQGPRQRAPTPGVAKPNQVSNTVRIQRVASRHPAPLPDSVKQYQPLNWKALPPAPELKLSKVENGIVISWKIDGYQEENHEEIASYQLYAYQETTSPPSTTLWKKIGDVKALPLPMACTLTQFMAGYKYYFAVRAVDVRSRLGPFSMPGSILLLNKM